MEVEFEVVPGYVLIIEADAIKKSHGVIVGIKDIREKDTGESLNEEDMIDFLSSKGHLVVDMVIKKVNNADKSLN